MMQHPAVLALALFLVMSCGCATRTERAERQAAALGYQRVELEGELFSHVAYFKPGEPRTTLHVYIEHDGIPWATPTQPSEDPTPRRLLMLEMMALDRAPALYLGRPCYFGLNLRPPCEAVWWTHRRFSADVVRSMNAALASFMAMHASIQTVELYGFSGGGVIAVLMAPGISGTRRIVTVAAPLDVDAWTARHGYSELVGSLSPLRQPPLAAGILQLHFVGSNDEIVWMDLVKPFVERQPTAEIKVATGYDHYCCWTQLWQDILVQRR